MGRQAHSAPSLTFTLPLLEGTATTRAASFASAISLQAALTKAVNHLGRRHCTVISNDRQVTTTSGDSKAYGGRHSVNVNEPLITTLEEPTHNWATPALTGSLTGGHPGPSAEGVSRDI